MKRFLFLALTALAVLVNVQARTWVLDDQHASFTAQDGDVIIGKYAMGEFYSISIADNAKVTFQGARIGFRDVSTTSVAPNVIPVNCLGNAEITISGEVHITTGREFPAIFIPQGKTLKIYGTDADSLYVHSGPKAAAIGAYNDVDAGSIQIYGGRIEAQGGRYAAAIGGAYLANCGGIDIYGGQIKATGGENAAAIGSGFDSSHAGYVNISGNVKVHAQGSFRSAGIGCGWLGTCGVINISGSNTNVTAIKGDESQCSIGLPKWFTTQSCGTITIGGKTYPDGVVRSYFNYPNIHDIDLSTMRNDFTVEDGDVLFGTLGADRIRITVADNAKITLRNAVIPELLGKGSACGLECLGDAEITLEGNNEVWHRGGGDYPAIFYPENHTLNIKGNGKLVAHGGGSSAAIGTGACLVWKESIGGINVSDEDIITCLNKWAGNLNIYSGTIEAYGGVNGPGIGAARHAHCGEIQILGGKVTAYGGQNAPGIGAAGWTGAENPTVCGDIRISGGTVYARGKGHAPAIGAENSYRLANCGNIWIMNTINKLTAVKGDDAEKCIWSPQGNVTINGETYPGGINLHAYYYPEEKVINLANQHFNITVPDGYTLTGTLTDNIKIEIEDGAEVLLQDVVINGNWDANTNYGGLTCLGDAVIRLEGTNAIKSPGARYAAISVPDSKTLEIYGPGSLKAEAYEAAGIGANHSQSCGHIIIFGGTIEASSQKWCAGIGGATGSAGLPLDDGHRVRNGYIYIYDGNVTAIGGENAAGIGSGYDDCTSANIFILGGVVKAVGNDKGAAIGAGGLGSASDVYLYSGIKSLKAYKGDRAPHSIGKGYGMSSFGRVFIDEKFYSTGIDINPYFFPNGNVINLGEITSDFTVQNNATLTGKLNSRVKITIGEGVTVTLQDAEINMPSNSSSNWAGLTCAGTASIVLKGTNIVTAMDGYNSAIYVPQNKTLFISGEGTLYAHSRGWAASIGGGYGKACGNIEIISGNIFAYSDNTVPQSYGAGIGGGWEGACGNIIIRGGVVTARGNGGSAGIGTSSHGFSSQDKRILLCGGRVYAYGGEGAPAIGAGYDSRIGNIEITEDMEYVYAEAGDDAVYAVGKSMAHPEKTTICGKFIVNGEERDYPAEDIYVYPEGAAIVNREAMTINLDTLGQSAANAPAANHQKAASATVLKFTLIHGDKLTGTLQRPIMLNVMKGATITLEDATINGSNNENYRWAGINCQGDANIIIAGNNTVKGFQENFPGIYVPQNSTLTLKGNGKLTASSNGKAAAIGAGNAAQDGRNCGNIVITSGTYDVTGGQYAAAIGGGASADCGYINIMPGVILNATKGQYAPNTIGAGQNGTCGNVEVSDWVSGDYTVSPMVLPIEPEYTPNYVNLSNLTSATTELMLMDGAVVTGTLPSNVNVKITVSNATAIGVTLRNVTINGKNNSSCQWAGLTCPYSAVIRLEGTNTIKGFYQGYPGIYVGADAHVTFKGTGTLNVSTNGNAPAIGGTSQYGCGWIIFKGGTINATGGAGCPAIGAAPNKRVYGPIEFYGGTINATGGSNAPGIGAGEGGDSYIRIYNGVTKVTATKGSGATYCLGSPTNPAECASLTLGDAVILDKASIGTNASFTYDPNSAHATSLDIADGARLWADFSAFSISLKENVSVTLDYNFTFAPTKAAIFVCNGNNTITIADPNCVIKSYKNLPGIHAGLAGKTVTFKGKYPDSKLTIIGNDAPAIGNVYYAPCGNIVIESGILDLTGGDYYPAIGDGYLLPATVNYCGDITIKGGTITARGGKLAPAIGSSAKGGTCGNITLVNTTTLLTAIAGEGATYSIGKTENGTCGTITVDGEIINEGIEYNPFVYPSAAGLSVRVLKNNETLSGVVNERIQIAANSIVIFDNVTIGGQEDYDYHNPGVECLGNAMIVFSGTNTIRSFNPNFPGLYVPEGSKCYLYRSDLDPDATLDVSSKGDIVNLNMVKKVNGRYMAASGNPKMAAGIGGYIDPVTNSPKNCGDIVIKSGHVIATGGAGHPGIGGGSFGSCGAIEISGGQVEAYGGTGAPGIGAGVSGNCGAIRFTRDVIRVESTAGENAPNSVGFAETESSVGLNSSCENIMVGSNDYGEGITDRVFIYEPTEEEKHESIEVVNTDESGVKTYKVLHNGQILIIRGNQIFTITGQRVK